ncbi:hypothetical protein J2S25_002781 [Mesobacillus stamsii]|uniref:HTH cro/C1-type domain-containing protein n=1 Tax=Mesobacillus stamsii TaxID=225347 RepID=A0ABU0FXB5_9BACI|nr:hypothetical protein [Mesobacillus stamsii]
MLKSNFRKIIETCPYKPAYIRDEIMRVHRNTFSGWMTGKHAPSVEDLFKLAYHLDRKVDEFYTWEEEE